MISRKKAELDDIHKVFEGDGIDSARGFTALDGISLTFYPGEIHVILGENGAGKSTLAHILSGLHRPSRGAIRVDGETLRFDSTSDALKNGIAMVHQRPLLAQEATVLENVLLGSGRFFLGTRKASKRLEAIKDRWGIALPDRARVETLSPADRFRTALLGALWREPDYLILDEPSGVLSPEEREGLFAALSRARGGGLGAIVITHRLEEAVARADRISVLRRGRLVWTSPVTDGRVRLPSGDRVEGETATLSASLLGGILNPDAPAMIGRDGDDRPRCPARDGSRPILALESVTVEGKDVEPLNGVSLAVCPGTITTIACYPGGGLGTLEDVLTGIRRPDAGTISIRGKTLRRAEHSPARFRSLGVAAIPSDRAFRGSHPDITIGELVTPYWRARLARTPKHEARIAEEVLSREGIDASPRRAVRTLSGGQLQRLILARELASDPAILVLSSPEWGLDVMSVASLRERIVALADEGKAIVALTEETGTDGMFPPDYALKDGYLS